MNDSVFLYPFDECITTRALDDHNDDCVVIYAVNNHDILYHEDKLVFGYLSAAERVIKSIYSRNPGHYPHAGDDCIAIPLLHLYSHALEIIFKLLLKTLNNHATNCKHLQEYKNNSDLLGLHELKPMAVAAKDIIPTKDTQLHFFKDFNDIVSFIDKFERFGIDSISTRYILSKRKQKYKIHEKQSYLNLKKMHKNVLKIVHTINEYIIGPHFYYCSRGHFSSEKINELRLVVNEMERKKDLFLNYKNNYESFSIANDNREVCIFDESTLAYWSKIGKLTEELKKTILLLDKNEVAILAMGFAFPNSSADLSTFKLRKVEDNIATIIRYALKYNEALNELNNNIAYLEQYFNN